MLPAMMQSIVNIAFICIGSTYLAATVPITVFCLYMIQKFYLRTSRQIRLLDLEAKSPVYQHFTESLEGTAVIRGLCWQEHFEQIAIRVLDESQKPYYIMYCIQTWLGLAIDLLIAALALVMTGLALNIPSSSSGGAIGVALTSILNLNSNLQVLLQNWTSAETSLGSVARTKSFEQDTPNENLPEETYDPGDEWPQGQVQLSDVEVTFEYVNDMSRKQGANWTPAMERRPSRG
jgi:ATP-binding cassette subfamily C (CFTR/MRP) protein 1